MMPRRVHAAGNRPRSAFGGSVSVAFALPLLLLLLWASLPLQAADRANKGAIRVGVFPFEPFNFLDKSGLAQGLNPDLLREIGREEGWTIEYVPGSWAEGLERLQREEIDLMVSVAHTPERAEIMDYTYEPVAELWGQVFVRPEGRSSNITDLAGRKVAVMRRDISGANFIDTAERFGIRCDIREYATHAEVFAAVRAGEVEAGVAPQHFGLRHARDYDLVGSTILFSPFSIYFTSKKGRHHELLSHIDAHLSTWKKDKDSIYYQKLSQWMGAAGTKHPFPAWLVSTFLAVVLAALVLGSLALYLRRAVRLKTKELRESEANYRFILDAMEESLLVIDTLGAVMFANERAARTLTGRGPEEIARKTSPNCCPRMKADRCWLPVCRRWKPARSRSGKPPSPCHPATAGSSTGSFPWNTARTGPGPYSPSRSTSPNAGRPRRPCARARNASPWPCRPPRTASSTGI